MASDTPKELPAEIRNLHFIVAENNPALQRNIVHALSSGGVKQCSAVSTGSEAWEAWQGDAQVGVVICAWNLPEIAGIEILKRIRADKGKRRQPAFIIMSSETTPEAVQTAKLSGADSFLAKPFSAEDIIPKVIDSVALRKQAAGPAAGNLGSLEADILGTSLMVELVFERYSTTVECDELEPEKCAIRVTNNYGLGTRLTLRFAVGGDGETYYPPVKGVVTKTERVPKEFGLYRLHLRFATPLKPGHGAGELLGRVGGGAAAP